MLTGPALMEQKLIDNEKKANLFLVGARFNGITRADDDRFRRSVTNMNILQLITSFSSREIPFSFCIRLFRVLKVFVCVDFGRSGCSNKVFFIFLRRMS